MIKKAICQYVALSDSENNLPENLFNVLFSYVDVKYLSDQEILKNNRIKSLIDWNSLEKNQLIRLIVRDKTTLERIDIEKYDFKPKDLIPIFLRHPDLVEFFDFNFDELSPIEAINMLNVSCEFIQKIDLGKYKYDRLQTSQIIKQFHKYDQIINKLNFDTLDHFSIRNMIIQSGEKFLHKIDLTKLKPTDWICIVSSRPEMISYCELNMFLENDCYNLIVIVKNFPEYDYLIFNNADKISAIGWEKLLILDPKKYSEYCDFKRLSVKNWEMIIKKQPSMIDVKNKYKF